MNVNFVKTAPQTYKPAEPETEEWDRKTKIGQVVSGDFKRVRNPGFHRKYFALLNIGFDNWEPPAIEGLDADLKIEKNFDRFRKDIIILCGFYERHFRIDGSVRVEPKSISFASMDDAEFQNLYSKTIDILIKHVYGGNMTPEQMDNTVNQYLSFA
jgi:hypothetical protein